MRILNLCVAASLRRKLEIPGLGLRLYRIRDLPLLYTLFSSEVFRTAGGAPGKPFRSFLSFWKWLLGTFEALYVIETRESGRDRIVGFIGLYNIEIGQTLWLSMGIFHPSWRRRGYGGKSLELLLDGILSSGVARTIYAQVRRTNDRSLRFFSRNGFEVTGGEGEKLLLERRVTPARGMQRDASIHHPELSGPRSRHDTFK